MTFLDIFAKTSILLDKK